MATERLRGGAWRTLRKRVFATFGTDCWMCGHEGADTVDHLVPLRSGGSNDLDNLRPAHGRPQPQWQCPGNYGRTESRQRRRAWVAPGW